MRKGRMGKTQMAAFFIIALMCASAPLFAQDLVPAQLTTLAQQVSDIFTGPLMKVILGILFAGAGIAFAFNKDNEKIKHSMVALMIGIGIIFTASQIVTKVAGTFGK